jgi:hypothetical protein
MTFKFEDVKLMFRDEIDNCLRPKVEMLDLKAFSGTIVQTFIPFTSKIGTLEIYSGGGQFTINFLDRSVQVNNVIGWVPVAQDCQVTSCQEYTISVVGSGTIGVGEEYYAGTCSLGVPIAFRGMCEDVCVPAFSFELFDLEDLPKVVVEYASRTRIVTEYLDGHALVEDIISVEIYSRYPSELDKIISVLEEYFKEHPEYPPDILHVGIVGIDPITLTRMEIFVRRIRVSIMRRV